ncbi:hypothetical protein, conserved [Plasmodium gonderi]|uniref:Uncharacterized protein n=1 Tax=Plasmodium gonderi TaxID=77519 RepID=A0A1Y1JDM0_PLAGO|nr:hypothetical protein, conserved [Plasmodium gonderi]GAW79307.1 hypothetical protein, conserved [Plasmodium gonderi]
MSRLSERCKHITDIARGSVRALQISHKGNLPKKISNNNGLAWKRKKVYEKNKKLFKVTENEVSKDNRELRNLLFKKKEYLLHEKDISKILKKVIKKKIKNDCVWDDIQRILFSFNLRFVNEGEKGATAPLQNPPQQETKQGINQDSLQNPQNRQAKQLITNKESKDSCTPYNQYFDHVNVYLLAIAMQKLNKRNAILFSFIFSYLRQYYKNMEPRHFLEIFHILTKNTFRHLEVTEHFPSPSRCDKFDRGWRKIAKGTSCMGEEMEKKKERTSFENYDQVFAQNYDQVFAQNYDQVFAQNYDQVFVQNYDQVFAQNYDQVFAQNYDQVFAQNYDQVFAKNYDQVFAKNYDSIFYKHNDHHGRAKTSLVQQHPYKEKIIQSEKNLLNLLALHCSENVNFFSLNDIGITCESLCFFSLKDNPFVHFWNDFLFYIFEVSPGRVGEGDKKLICEGTNGEDPPFLSRRSNYVKKYERSEFFGKRRIQRRRKRGGGASHQNYECQENHKNNECRENHKNHERYQLCEKYAELSGRNVLSLLKYIALYKDTHPQITLLGNKISLIFFKMSFDTTLHECSEIFHLFNCLDQLDKNKMHLKERIGIYEAQFENAFLTHHDMKCLLTISQLCFEIFHYVPFLKIYANNVHKIFNENAIKLIKLLLKSYEYNCETHYVWPCGGKSHYIVKKNDISKKAHSNGVCKKKTDSLTYVYTDNIASHVYTGVENTIICLLSALVPTCHEVFTQLSYREILFLLGIFDRNKVDNTDTHKLISKLICDEMYKKILSIEHFPHVYIDYIFLITMAIYKDKNCVDNNLIHHLIKMILKKKEDKLWQKRRHHYTLYLLTLYREGVGGRRANNRTVFSWVPYFNFVFRNIFTTLEERTLYDFLLIYFKKTERNYYKLLICRLFPGEGQGRTDFHKNGEPCRGGKIQMKVVGENSPSQVFLHNELLILSEKQFKRELLKMFLHLWIAYPIRPGRKLLGFLIVMNTYYADADMRFYLFSPHMVRKMKRFIELLSAKMATKKGTSYFVHLCDNPITKEPIRMNLCKLQYCYQRILNKVKKLEKHDIVKKSISVDKHQLFNASRNYLLNDYKHKKSIVVRTDIPNGRPAKYFQNCKRGDDILGSLSIYGQMDGSP